MMMVKPSNCGQSSLFRPFLPTNSVGPAGDDGHAGRGRWVTAKSGGNRHTLDVTDYGARSTWSIIRRRTST